MSTDKRPWKPWGDHPVVVLIFLIAALIPIAIFVKGNLDNNNGNNSLNFLIRVTDETGDSISGAKTMMLYREGGISQYTDVNGTVSFSFPASTSRTFRIIVEAEGFQIYELLLQQFPDDVINIRLEERKGELANVILRVVDNETESPISNAQIILASDGHLFREVSDSDGFAQFTLEFPTDAKIDTQISVSAEKYKIENQITTLLPEKLQYVLMNVDSLSVKIPVIPTTSTEISTNIQESLETASPGIGQDVLIGSGVLVSHDASGYGLRITILKPDSQPWEGVYTEVYEQIADVTGNPARGNRIDTGYLNQQGLVDYDLGDGVFVVCVSDNASPGYDWTDRDCIYNLDVKSGELTLVLIQPGQLEIGIVGATGEPWEGVYYQVYTQKKDVNGNPVTDNRVASGYTDNAGLGRETLTPGIYAVSIDLRGYNWGNMATEKGQLNIVIEKGKSNRIIVNMGQLFIGLRSPNGEPATNVYVEVYTQKNDINGQRIVADRVWSGYTDIGGIAEISLTNGLYALKLNDNVLYDIPIEGGRITETGGNSFNQK